MGITLFNGDLMLLQTNSILKRNYQASLSVSLSLISLSLCDTHILFFPFMTQVT